MILNICISMIYNFQLQLNKSVLTSDCKVYCDVNSVLKNLVIFLSYVRFLKI